MDKKISSKGIRNFLKLTLDLEVYEYQLEFAFDKDLTEYSKDIQGNIYYLQFERFKKPMHYLVVGKNNFKLIIDQKETDLSPQWQEYCKDKDVDMHLEHMHGGSRFG